MSRLNCAPPSSILLMLACAPLVASVAGEPPVDPRVEIAKKLPGATVDQLKPAPIPGMYEYAKGTDIGYVTSDGRFFLSGDLYDIEEGANLTDQRRADARRKLLGSLSDSEMVIFSPKTAPKYTITVFTDVDCGYCRKLHSEIKELNRLGVRVRYAFYPRSGPGSESWKTAEAVWCSANRNDALTRAKLGEPIKVKDCGPTPVAREYQLAEELNIRGTPGIFTPEGDYLPGYMPAAQLVAELKSLQKK